MSATYEVTLRTVDGKSDVVQIEEVELGFNAMGWLMFVDDQRETVATFAPDAVRFVIKLEGNDPSSILMNVEPDEIQSIN